jgi:hypothetical protein
MSDATILLSMAVFIVYAQRKKRWSLFWKTIGGQYTVVPLGSTPSKAPTTSPAAKTPASTQSQADANASSQLNPTQIKNPSDPRTGG